MSSWYKAVGAFEVLPITTKLVSEILRIALFRISTRGNCGSVQEFNLTLMTARRSAPSFVYAAMSVSAVKLTYVQLQLPVSVSANHRRAREASVPA